MSQALARVGGALTSIDPSEANIEVARAHSAACATLRRNPPDYQVATAEGLAATGASFDVVVASEVLEHVNDLPMFVGACMSMVKVCLQRAVRAG